MSVVPAVPEERGEAGEAVELAAEAGVVRPVAGQAGRREAQHDHARVRLQQLGLVDAHLVQRGRLEVLDEHVADARRDA